MIKTKRREVWWVDFDPSISGEIKKTRPAVVISNDFTNSYSNRIQVIPLTTNIEKCYPCEAYIKLKKNKCKAMTDQIMTVSKNRLKSKIDTISHFDFKLIENALKIQLNLN